MSIYVLVQVQRIHHQSDLRIIQIVFLQEWGLTIPEKCSTMYATGVGHPQIVFLYKQLALSVVGKFPFCKYTKLHFTCRKLVLESCHAQSVGPHKYQWPVEPHFKAYHINVLLNHSVSSVNSMSWHGRQNVPNHNLISFNQISFGE